MGQELFMLMFNVCHDETGMSTSVQRRKKSGRMNKVLTILRGKSCV